MNSMILAIFVFIGVTGMVGAVAFVLLKGSSEGRAMSRLDTLVGRSGRNNTDSSADLMLRQALQDASQGNLLERLTPDVLRVSKMFIQADVQVKPSALFGLSIALAIVGGLISSILIDFYFAPIGACILGPLPFVWLWFKRNSRLKAFAAQLPEGMELLARALRAGQSLAAGLSVVSTEMPDPIAKEFGRVFEEQNLGVALEEAMDHMCERVPNLDLRFFVTSVNIQRQTGGDLAEILDRIGHVIRERFKILGQIKALTGEGRMSGVVLIALPIGLFLMLLHMKPDYVGLLWKDPTGQYMSIAAVILMLVGSYSIKKIIDIKV